MKLNYDKAPADTTETFWLVWRDNGASSHRRHNSLESAKAEALRLAMKEGAAFYVVESVTRVEVRKEAVWFVCAPQPPESQGEKS